jgi:ABC-2 type transport system permease protein
MASPDAAAGEVAPLAPMLARQIRTEILKLWRLPTFSATSLILPVLFFVFFGLRDIGATARGTDAGAYFLASMAAYGVLNVMLFSFGIGVATETALNMDVLMRATPMPLWVFLAAKVVTAACFALLSLLTLLTFATVVGGLRLGPEVWLALSWRLIVGSIPFIGLGFAIGYAVPPRSAPAVLNLIYLPLAFASGMFVPPGQLPTFVQRATPYLPTYHFAQLAWGAVGASGVDLGTTLLWLAGYAVVFLGLAVRFGQYAHERKFG